jgi:hypothetical protein
VSVAGRHRAVLRMIIPVVALVVPAFAARALDVEFPTRPVHREVLALFDSRYEKSPAETRIHHLAEMPLNWLGFTVTYADVNGPLPDASEVERYRGLVTWFIEPLGDARRYLAWLDAATGKGLRFACLAELSPGEPPGTEAVIARIFARLGLKPADQYVNVTHRAKISLMNGEMAGFERAIDKALPAFRVVEQASAAVKVHLAASLPAEEGEQTSVLISTNSGGGYVADDFTFYYEASTERARWIVNPFLFFKLALGDERFPIPDVTTLDGRRMYFSHIDGDGWNNISEIEGYREAQVPAAEVIRREIIAPYPDLPVTVGLIGGDAVTSLGGMEIARESAKKIYALKQVETASHTYTHPFSWGFFENYDRKAEMALIDKAAHPDQSLMDRVRGMLYRVAGKAELSHSHERYVAGSADLPRSYLKEPFDIGTEVKRALAISEELSPPGKKAAIYLWSGDTEPFEAAVRQTRLAGVRNMNGGDTRLDGEFPSVFYVPPISRPVGKERQIYAANSNENTYTNNWHGPFYGQITLEETLNNTETPRRLKPFNLYYHMFSGEKAGSLAALKHFVNLARTSRVIPVKASEYAAIADDFFSAEIEQIDPSAWSVAKRGALQTLRFDDAQQLGVNYTRSAGVLGSTRQNGSLYVTLDPASEPVIVALQTGEADAVKFEPGEAHLVESRWQLKNMRREACGFRIEAQGYGPGDMVWGTAPGQLFDIAAIRNGVQIYSGAAAADDGGGLAASIEIDAQDPVELSFKCHDR